MLIFVEVRLVIFVLEDNFSCSSSIDLIMILNTAISRPLTMLRGTMYCAII